MNPYKTAQAERKAKGTLFVDGHEVANTLQCVHCGHHWVSLKGSGRKRGFCLNCMGPVCGPRCYDCIPFLKKLDLYEAGKLKVLR